MEGRVATQKEREEDLGRERRDVGRVCVAMQRSHVKCTVCVTVSVRYTDTP